MKKNLAVLALAFLACATFASAQVINEFVRDHTGTDIDEYVEVYSDDPGFDCTILSVIEIEGEGTGKGTIDEVFAVPACDPITGLAFIDIDPGTDSLENGTNTLLLVSNFTGAEGDDIDIDDDGTLDDTPWMTELDGVAIADTVPGDDTFYANVVLMADFDGGIFDVGGASRIPDGMDTDTTTDWVRNDFDGAGLPCCDPGTPDDGEALNTPNASNEVIMGGGDQLTISGTCPGEITVAYTGGTPNGVAGVIFSTMAGMDALAAGPCAGEVTELSSPSLLTTLVLDANGELAINRTATEGNCGLMLQVVDGMTCTLSNSATIE